MDPATTAASIAAEAKRQGHELGWSFFYCPHERAATARLATIGLNPGGGRPDGTDWARQIQFEDRKGNSYRCQKWGPNCTETQLQKQIGKLFDVARVTDEEVVSLNLVPFRSPNWKMLPHPALAIDFGIALVKPILASSRLKLIVGFGLSVAESRFVDQLGFKSDNDFGIRTGWGNIRARRYKRGNQTLLMLPHLSRFAILGRPQAIEIEAEIRQAMSS